MSDNKFAKAEDECIKNPKNCPDGFSFSLFFKPEYTETDNELVLESDKADKEYIISNGGEVGRPGFSVYRKGGNLGAIGIYFCKNCERSELIFDREHVAPRS